MTGQAGLLVKNGKSSGFVYGADIGEFETLTSRDDVLALVHDAHHALDKLSAFHLPTACIIDGFALGGGLELALACDFLVGLDSPKTQLGLPEVTLGLLPGFGGTARSAARMGAYDAVQFMIRGKPLSASGALDCGLLDAVLPNLASAEKAVFDWMQAQNKAKPSQKQGPFALDVGQSQEIEQGLHVHYQVAHTPAPFAIFDHLSGIDKARPDQCFGALKRSEKQLFADLMMSPASKGLRRSYHLQTKMKKAAKHQQKVTKMLVVGAGVMGRDIALVGLMAGLQVTLIDIEQSVLSDAQRSISALLARRLKEPAKIDEALARLSLSAKLVIAQDIELVIEAASENLAVKQSLFSEIEKQASKECLLATNTSSIPIEGIAASLTQSERLVGVHFFNPASVMKLVEIIEGKQTNSDVLDRARQAAGQLGKWPVLCRSAPGFIVNRALLPYIYHAIEAMLFAEDSLAQAAYIDTAMVRFGLKMGPLELADQIGLDVCLMAGEPLHIDEKVAAFLKAKIAAGQLGRKSGQGIYRWQDKQAQRPDIEMSYEEAEKVAMQRLDIMITACKAILSEKVAASADDIDAAMIFGTGFPDFRGGPLYWANAR